jgi:tetratricopeptide (TPR) repeat protein
MFQGWRLKLREVQEAADQGQLDEACRLLLHSDLREYLPGRRLGARVATAMADRGQRRAVQGDLVAGWQDLRAARSLAGETGAVLDAEQEILALALGEAESCLEQGDAARAISLLQTLEQLQAPTESLRWLKEVARGLEAARHLAQRGKFAEAVSQAEAAAAVRPKLAYVQHKVQEYRARIEPFRQLVEALHRAVAEQQWSAAVKLADQALELAPENRLAASVRQQAWAQVGTKLVESRVGAGAARAAAQAVAGPTSRENGRPPAGGVSLADPPRGRRLLLWVDGVGGYLMCLGEDLVLGQAAPDTAVDIPIQADISRRHARISRRGEGYVLEAWHTTRVNGVTVRQPTLLSDGDEIHLSHAVHLRFRQPHALSASARLDFLSHHRTQPKADAIVLMAECCVLGPKWKNHIVCRDWQNDVVVYRRGDELMCRALGSIEIDGRAHEGHGPVEPNAHISGSDFSLTLEELA